MSVETIGRHEVIVGAHFGHDTPVDHADHVGVPYGGQPVGYGDARSALHGFVQGRLHDLRANEISDYAIRVLSRWRARARARIET